MGSRKQRKARDRKQTRTQLLQRTRELEDRCKKQQRDLLETQKELYSLYCGLGDYSAADAIVKVTTTIPKCFYRKNTQEIAKSLRKIRK